MPMNPQYSAVLVVIQPLGLIQGAVITYKAVYGIGPGISGPAYLLSFLPVRYILTEWVSLGLHY